jgi:GT2 family glycosyltransferase
VESQSLLTRDVVAVIVNWKRADLTDRCVRSIMGGNVVPAVIVVVENESAETSGLSFLEPGEGPRVIRVHSRANRGYGGGANLGIEIALQSHPEAVFLVNNDAVVDPHCIGTLRESMQRSGAAIVGGRCVSETGDADVGYARRWPAAIWGRGVVPSVRIGQPPSVDMVDGALWLVSRACLERSMERRGVFLDALYFLYWEDADLCMFARRQGMKCVFDAQATARHAVAASSGGSYNPRGLYYQSRNVIFFTCRWSPPLQLLLYLPIVVLHRLAAFAKHILGRRFPQARAVGNGLWHGFRGVRWKSTKL